MNISVTLLCAFSEHLTIKGNAPRTIINKLSQVKRFVLLSGGNITPFEDSRLSMAKDAQLKRKDVRTNVKPLIPIHLFKQALLYIPETFEGFSLKAILLIIYYGALRQSEIVPPTVKDFNYKIYMYKLNVTFAHVSFVVKIFDSRRNNFRLAQGPIINNEKYGFQAETFKSFWYIQKNLLK